MSKLTGKKIALGQTIFCLIWIATGALTMVMEMLSLIAATTALVVEVLLLELWAVLRMPSHRWRKVAIGIAPD